VEPPSSRRAGLRQLQRKARRAAQALRRLPGALEAAAGLQEQNNELLRRADESIALLREVAGERHRSAYVADGTAWVRTRWGRKVLVDTTDLLLTPWLLVDGIWEPEVTDFFQRTIEPGQVVVDVGANVGYFTMLAAHLTTHTGHVYAFEAQPDTYRLLVKGILANWMEPYVTAEQLAVYEDSRDLELFVRRRFAGNSSIVRSRPNVEVEDSVDAVRVSATSLDDYFSGLDTRIDFVKVDVEGAELHVFRGMHKILEANPDLTVMCEWSPDQAHEAGNPASELVEEFVRAEFTIRRIGDESRRIRPQELVDMPYCNIALRRE
jgi:FkbM family methyltransferase